MTLSRFPIARVTPVESDTLPASSLLQFALGYDAVTDQGEPEEATARFVATVTHTIDDATLAADWMRLEADGTSSVFQTRSWQKGLMTHLVQQSNAEPLFVTIRSARTGDAVAIFPLQRRRQRGFMLIEYLANDFCDTCQPLLASGFDLSQDALAAFITTLVDALPAADILRLSKMQRDLFGQPNPFADLAGCSPSLDQTFPIALSPSDPAFVGDTSAFKTYQKQWRKLSRREGIAFERFETPEAIAAAFDAMIALRNSRFSDLNRDDLLNNAEVTAFYRAMALLPENERTARICGLKVGDAYTAYIYLLEKSGKFSTVISAMDNTVGNAYAPGLILFTKIFEQAVEHGLTHGDIGIGYMHYKTRFAARQNPLFVWNRALSIKGRIGLAVDGLTRQAKHLARTNATIRMIAAKIFNRKLAAPADLPAPGKPTVTDEHACGQKGDPTA